MSESHVMSWKNSCASLVEKENKIRKEGSDNSIAPASADDARTSLTFIACECFNSHFCDRRMAARQ